MFRTLQKREAGSQRGRETTSGFLLINLFILNWRLITLQYCSGFCHTLTWISHGDTYMFPPSCTTPPTSLPIPSLRVIPVHQPWALSHESNLDWRSISHMVIYMFQSYSLKSSHPRLLPQSPKVSSLSLCLFCCLAYSVIITIFLNSIYMHLYTVSVFFFLTYFTPDNRLQFHPSGFWNRTGSITRVQTQAGI